MSTSAQKLGWGKPGSAAEKVASVVGNSNQITIFGYPTGTAMANGTAAGRRVGWFAPAASLAAFTNAGWALLDAAVKWATVPEVVFITPNTTLSTAETAVKTRLEGSTLKMKVRLQTPSAVTATNVVPSKLVVISENVSASSLGTKLTSVAIPTLVLANALYPTFQLAGAGSGSPRGCRPGWSPAPRGRDR